MGIVRVQKNSNYSVISNVHLQDESLSWKAKGILSYLLSKPDDWQIYIAHLKNQSTDGKDATASGIRELIEAGYITRDYTRNEAGQIIGRDYVVYETALEDKALEKPVNGDDNPKTENPTLDNPTTVKPSLLNTDTIKDGLKTNNDDIQAPPDPVSEPNKETSPSLSKNELITLVPEDFQTKAVERVIEQAISTYSAGYIKSAIQYTTDHSTGQTGQKYKAYLSKCIEGGWAYGYESPKAYVAQDVKSKFSKMPIDTLTLMADAGNQFAVDELQRRKK